MRGIRWCLCCLDTSGTKIYGRHDGVTEVAGDSDAAPAEGNWFTVRLNLCWLMLGMAWRVWRLDSDCRRFHNTVEQALSDHPAKGMEQRTALELLDVCRS